MSPASHPSKGVRLFYSYSHRDERLARQFDSQIRALQLQGLVETWYDRQIAPGDDWATEIEENLRAANIILLLLSSDFISSGYCIEKEMRVAMQRHAAGEAKVIPIILRFCDWQDVPFDGAGVGRLGDLQALPKDTKPVAQWRSRDEAFLNVVQGIKRIIREAGATVPPTSRARPAVAEPSASRTLPAGAQHVPRLPELLPYLCDRSAQESRLAAALRRWRESGLTRRPFVCLVHGDDNEELDWFMQRLQVDTLPRMLASGARPGERPLYDPGLGSLVSHFLALPSPAGITRPFEFLQHEVGIAVADDMDADESAVARAVSRRFRTPLLFHSTMSSRDWDSDGAAALSAYLDFWRSFPDVEAGRTLALLFLKYKTGGEGAARERFTALNESAAFSLGQLALELGDNGDNRGGAYTVVLPRLPPVLLRDAEAWFHSTKHFRNRCREHPFALCRVEQAVSQVEQFYEEQASAAAAGVPMRRLAPRLREIAEASHCGVAV
jgi:TIR domain/inactive STAND